MEGAGWKQEPLWLRLPFWLVVAFGILVVLGLGALLWFALTPTRDSERRQRPFEPSARS
jgi:type VI protein secretion system component VasF